MIPTAPEQPWGRLAIVHFFVVAAVATAVFILCTANELGPFGPLVIAEAFYLLGFAASLEAVLLVVAAWHAAAKAIERRRASRAVASSDRRGALA